MILYIVIFIFGLLIGSFLNAVIYRLHSGEGIVKTRSHCVKCGHVLTWRELVPIFSFIIQKGRCRACSARISLQYPFVELATAILFVLVLFSHGGSPAGGQFFSLVYLLIISSLLIVIFVYDLKHYIIPDKIVYPAIMVSGIWYLVSSIFLDSYTKYSIVDIIYSPVGAFAFFAAIFFVSKGKWLGFGDVKLVFFMGLLLGWPGILVALFAAFMLGGIMGLGLIATGKKNMKSQVPFGPVLVVGTFAALFWGEEIVRWYLGLFV